MIVDDDEDIRIGLNMRLRSEGYATCFAGDAVSAVATARRENPDLILLDLGLPAGDGFVVMKRLRLLPSLGCVPVIVYSAREARGNRERALQAGAVAYFQKPCDAHELLAAIRMAVGDPAPAAVPTGPPAG